MVRRMGSELGDLVEGELDRGLALEERDEDGELAALRLDLADRAGKARERTLLDGDRLAGLEVDLGGDRGAGGRTAAALRGAGAGLDGRLRDLDHALEHLERLVEPERRRVVRVADEAGDAGGV